MSESDKSWYTISNLDQIDTPALIIYRDRVKKNIQQLKKMIDDPERLRPHVKTHKTVEGSLLLMEAGINKFKCSTISEAEMLGICKAKDVLLAYPIFGPKVSRLIALVERYPETKFSCLIDNFTSAERISENALSHNLILAVYIDLNLGMDRTGIAPGKKALQLYEKCSFLKGIALKGFHAYDGHIREKNLEKRTLIAQETFAPVEKMRQELVIRGFKEPKIIIGGSPTFPIYAKKEKVECSPGTFIFWDKGYQDTLPEQQFLPAALIITRVVSLPDKNKICLDLGYKAIASENPLDYRIHFLNAPDLQILSQSEEHLVMEVPEGASWEVGDVFYGLPIHICPTCALYEKANIVEDREIVGTWDIIARNRSINV